MIYLFFLYFYFFYGVCIMFLYRLQYHKELVDLKGFFAKLSS